MSQRTVNTASTLNDDADARSSPRLGQADLEKHDPHRARDKPHRQSSITNEQPLRTNAEEPPLQTGQPYVRPNSPAPAPQDIDALFKPSYPQLESHSALVLATIWGILARLGLIWIGGFANRQVFSLIWAQMVGCTVIGLVMERKEALQRISPPLFVMFGTGFCGSITTWSSMMSDVFTAFANLDQPAGTSRFAGFLSGMAITLVTLIASMTCLQFGVHLSSFLPHHPIPHRQLPGQALFNWTMLLLGPLCWLGALFLLIFGPHSWRSRATFAIVLGPPGSIVRFHVSKLLNTRIPSLPLGTLTVNSVSVLLFAVAALFARHPRAGLTCAALKGLQDGFCGSLSTISTMAVELRGLKRAQSYRYFILSWVVSQALFVVVLGSWVWTGDRGAMCWNR